MRIRAHYVILALLLLAFGGSVPAVEKKPKSTPSTQQPNVPSPKRKDSQQVKPKSKPVQQKKFDDFIDKNKNGVDDRKEKPTR